MIAMASNTILIIVLGINAYSLVTLVALV